MEHKQRLCIFKFMHGKLNVCSTDGREFGYSRVYKEAFKSANTSINHSKQLAIPNVRWDDASIEAYIAPNTTFSSNDLLLQIRDRGCWWDAIQWHINKSGDSTRDSCASACSKPLPGGSGPRLIKMDVSVNEAREDNMRGDIMERNVRKWPQEGAGQLERKRQDNFTRVW